MHLCNNTMGSYHCSCNAGYSLAPGGKICSDINECMTGVRCQHSCVNTNGSYYCECADGYLLDETDQRSCHG